MDFYLFRWSLKRTGNLFAYNPYEKEVSREDWLRFALSEPFTFMHRKQEFVFVPEHDREDIDSKFIVGWMARKALSQERLSPEEGLAPTEHVSWRAAFLAVDPTHHEDGQKVAVEQTVDVGRPASLVKSLVEALGKRVDAPFEVLAYPILESGTFWNFVDASNNRIKTISFTLVAPNMFGGKEDLQKELRELRDNENVSQVKATLTSDTSLNARTERMREVVDYTEKGAGKLTARSVTGEPYNSEQHAAKRTVLVEPHSTGRVREFIRQIGGLLDKIF